MKLIRIALSSTIALLLLAQTGGTVAARQNPVAAAQAQAQTRATPQAIPASKPATLKQAYIPALNKWVKFTHRQAMKGRASQNSFRLPGSSLPPVALPLDNTGQQTVPAPMDGNDQYGDCGEAMAAHADNIYTFRQGKAAASIFDQTALINQYLSVSGGDNGLDENDVVNQIWRKGIAGNAQAIIVDSLDIDVTNVPLAQYALANFGTIQVAWSVPDSFLSQFATGAQFLAPQVPDPANGHFTPISDIDAQGNYSLWTWGSYCWVSPSFLASVQPQSFVAFSPRNFDPTTGLDSKGRHITTQAAAWQACGGNPIPAAVISAFPPISPAPAPTPAPSPNPTPVVNPPTPTPSGGGLVVMITSTGSPTVTIAIPAGSSISITATTLTIFGGQSITLTLPPGASISILSNPAPSASSGSKRAA